MENKTTIPLKKHANYLNGAVILVRLLVGLTFVFSGFVKAVDPLGSSYKFADYLNVLGLDFLLPTTLFAAVVLAAFEFWLGVSLITGYRIKQSIILLNLFMVFMTPLALWISISNPVSNCGCFGDAIKLTNWQTFYKNVVMSGFTVFLFINRCKLTPLFSKHTQGLVSLYTLLFIVGVSWISHEYLPIVDFRPYKIGNNITKMMSVPEDAQTEQYENIFVYAKDGVEKEFTLENYPEGDSSWTFVRREDKLISKGYVPPINDFSIELNGSDITQEVLQDSSYTFLLISPRLENASDEEIDRINEIYDYCVKFGYRFYCLTASPQSVIDEWSADTGAEYPFAITDEIPLKTIIRSNPGLVLLKKGAILRKWPHTLLPETEMSDMPLDQTKWGKEDNMLSGTKVSLFAGAFIVPLILLFIIERIIGWCVRMYRNRHNKKEKQSPDNPEIEEII
ncbi:MAG: DoxX family protein [Bacteroidales bacterium]|nr:DoxX family protein [Bacteroidales bacterium]